MTPEELAAKIASLEAVIDARLSGSDARRVKEGDRETDFAHADLADMRQRLAELKALQAGRSTRVAARRILF